MILAFIFIFIEDLVEIEGRIPSQGNNTINVKYQTV